MDDWPMHSLLLALILAVLFVFTLIAAVFKLEFTGPSIYFIWFATAFLTIGFMSIAGDSVTGLKRGFLIDSRNKVSLSRLQLIIWTIIIISSLYSIFIWNLSAPDTASPEMTGAALSAALNIDVPNELLALMGLSATTAVAAPMVLGMKKDAQPDEDEKKKTIDQINDGAGVETKAESVGQVVRNSHQDNARFTDIFKGEETGNAAYLDMAKVQMFFFTVVVAAAYTALILKSFPTDAFAPVAGFPPLSAGILTLLGISQAGYVTNKAVPHSKSAASGG